MGYREFTQAISLTEAFAEYRRSKEFRDVLKSGHYVYAEGMFVLNDARVVAHVDGKFQLTAYARAHLPEIALTFETVPRDGISEPVFDIPRVDRDLYFKEDANPTETGFKSAVFEARKKIHDAVLGLLPQIKECRDGWTAIRILIAHFAGKNKKKDGTEIPDLSRERKKFLEVTGLSGNDWRWIMDSAERMGSLGRDDAKKPHNPNRIKVISFAAGYDLDVATTNIFLEKAGQAEITNILTSRENAVYAYMLEAFVGQGLDARNVFLESQNVEQIGIRKKRNGDGWED